MKSLGVLCDGINEINSHPKCVYVQHTHAAHSHVVRTPYSNIIMYILRLCVLHAYACICLAPERISAKHAQRCML